MGIRLATLKDINILSFYDNHISSKELGNLIKLNRVYVFEKENNFMGWLRYNLFWDNTPFMNMLYLLEDNRGKGLGTQIVGYWEDEMKILGYSNVMTSTASNECAQHFYNKLGYRAVGGFSPVGEPYELILSKAL